MRIRTDGCALCGSTWGDYYEEVEGARRFFCCEICARELRALCVAIRDATQWPEIGALELEGGRYGRTATAHWGATTARFSVRFDVEGNLSRFGPISESGPEI